MNMVNRVGLPGPAPPATSNSSVAARGTGETTPFEHALTKAGPKGPETVNAVDGPLDTEPGSPDLETTIQLLLGAEAPPGDQTVNGHAGQPDRVAEVVPGETGTGGPVEAKNVVAPMPQLVFTPAEAEVGQPPAALPLADAVGSAAGRTVPTTGAAASTVRTEAPPAAVPDAADGPQGAGRPETPPVVLPSATADAPRAEASPVAVPDGEQQRALPLNRASVDGTAAPEQSTVIDADAEIFTQPGAAEGEVAPADANAPKLGGAATEPVLPNADGQSAAQRAPTASVNVETATDVPVEAVVIPASQPSSSSVRSATAVAAPEAAVTSTGDEAFVADLASTVRRASLLGDHQVRLLLNPPELGHLDIRIVDSSDGLRVVMKASTAAARELIEQQLPSLRGALEARDLRVERLEVGQSLESSVEEQAERGLRQDGRDGQGTNQSGDDAVPWSPVASLRSDESGELVGVGQATASDSSTRTAASDGRLNVLA